MRSRGYSIQNNGMLKSICLCACEYPCAHVLSLSVASALMGEGALLESELDSLTDDQFKALNFNAELYNEDHPNRGGTLALVAVFLAEMNQPALLNRLLSLPDEIFATIHFNAAFEYHQNQYQNITLAWAAAYRAHAGKPELLNKILRLSDESFAFIDFNAGPVKTVISKSKTLAFWAASLAVQGQPALWNRFLSTLSSKEHYSSIQFYLVPEGDPFDDVAVLILWAIYLALKNEMGLLRGLLFQAINVGPAFTLPESVACELLPAFKENIDDIYKILDAIFRCQRLLAHSNDTVYQEVVIIIDAIPPQYVVIKDCLISLLVPPLTQSVDLFIPKMQSEEAIEWCAELGGIMNEFEGNAPWVEESLCEGAVEAAESLSRPATPSTPHQVMAEYQGNEKASDSLPPSPEKPVVKLRPWGIFAPVATHSVLGKENHPTPSLSSPAKRTRISCE